MDLNIYVIKRFTLCKFEVILSVWFYIFYISSIVVVIENLI